METVGNLANLSGLIELESGRPIFIGNYSYVYKAKYQRSSGHIFVAVKVLKEMQDAKDRTMLRKVERERIIWARLEHPNVVPLYGFADDDELFQPFGALVSPWRLRGNAFKFLKTEGCRKSIKERLILWKGVVAGVEYLHNYKPSLIHGDLKPENVLIDDYGTPQICDFGLASIYLEEGHSGWTTTSEHTGTIRYLAYELLRDGDDVTPTMATDIFALGCIGLQFYFDQIPYAYRKNNKYGQVYQEIKSGKPPATQPPGLHAEGLSFWIILESCWDKEPTVRPSAQQLLAHSQMLLSTTHNTRAASLPFPSMDIENTFSDEMDDVGQWPEVPDLNGQVEVLDHRPIYVSNYSRIYRGKLRQDGQLVAIKVLNNDLLGANLHTMHRKFERERRTWGALNHPNILPLYGFANEEDLFQPYGALISPWLERRDASRFLKEYSHSMTTEQRTGIWKDVVAGVKYLHSYKPLLIHGDPKPGNILIDNFGRAQICDFGLIRIFLEEGSSGMTTTTVHTGTERYLAYELIMGGDDARPTTFSDIYAVGCIGLEFIFSTMAYAKERGWKIFAEIRRGVPPAMRPLDVPTYLESTWTMIEQCWEKEPSRRPSAASLLTWLEDRMNSPHAFSGLS